MLHIYDLWKIYESLKFKLKLFETLRLQFPVAKAAEKGEMQLLFVFKANERWSSNSRAGSPL
jgi:hypothetical protein